MTTLNVKKTPKNVRHTISGSEKNVLWFFWERLLKSRYGSIVFEKYQQHFKKIFEERFSRVPTKIFKSKLLSQKSVKLSEKELTQVYYNGLLYPIEIEYLHKHYVRGYFICNWCHYKREKIFYFEKFLQKVEVIEAFDKDTIGFWEKGIQELKKSIKNGNENIIEEAAITVKQKPWELLNAMVWESVNSKSKMTKIEVGLTELDLDDLLWDAAESWRNSKKCILMFDEILYHFPGAMDVSECGWFYYRRGLAKSLINDFLGAIADFGKAIGLELVPIDSKHDALFYFERGMAKYNLKDYDGAKKDITIGGYKDLKLFNYWKTEMFDDSKHPLLFEIFNAIVDEGIGELWNICQPS